jgi:ribosomal-protein-alanine N-acetyltransferase
MSDATIQWEHVFAQFPVLETERFLLRQPAPSDTDAFFSLYSNQEMHRYLGRHPMQKRDEAEARIASYRQQWHDQTGIEWFLVPKGDEANIIGTVVTFSISHYNQRGEFGYALSPDWWRKGVMMEATTRALDYLFMQTPMHSLVAQTDPANEASQGLLKKLGFVQEGYLREDFYHPVKEQFTDTTVFGLLRREWLAGRD